jgi:hypothetical protein
VLFFEFVKKPHFWSFNYFRSKEQLVLVLWKKLKIKRAIGSSYFKNLEKLVLWPIFQLSHIFWEPWLYTKTNSFKFLRWQLFGQFFDIFIFLRIMVRYQNWHSENFENWWVSGYIFDLIIDEYLSLIFRTAQMVLNLVI